MQFYGGHNQQQFESRITGGYNPLGMGLLSDLIDLVDGVIQGRIVGRCSPVGVPFSTLPNLYASYGRAEMEYLPQNIREGNSLQKAWFKEAGHNVDQKKIEEK